jgi:hypothetical protein
MSEQNNQNNSGAGASRTPPRHRQDNRNRQRNPHHRNNRGPQNNSQRPVGSNRGHDPHRRTPHSHQNSNSGATSLDHLLLQYDKLLDQHIDARKKYYEFYYRADRNRLLKLEEQFYISVQRLKKFERELRPWQLEQLKKHRTEIYPPDNTFSQHHKEEPLDAQNNDSKVQLPLGVNFHLTSIQHSRLSYKEDTEQSMGSMEDYIKYKAQLK